ncbi:GntR family transcriptional regulator [Roseomonas elaeocarpi]|uniref:FCD domain-containing protein n=1 Tax=Roseomonas elaeocarpi TaxID=907779 RepID=A0ABV6JV38_9PROT
MRSSTVRRAAHNRCLGLLSRMAPGEVLGSELALAARLEVSRTTVRAVLPPLVEAGILRSQEGRLCLGRSPVPGDYFPEAQTETAAALVERRFMQWVLLGDCRPGQVIRIAELARQFGTSNTAIREYLSHFRHFGLLERRAGGNWMFRGITEEFAAEVYELREMFELRSARRFAALPPEAPAWAELATLEREHRTLLGEIEERYREFSSLDERFHRLIHDASHNRFIVEHYALLAMIFHYHYQWNKRDEQERNAVAIGEHLRYIEALRSRDPQAIDEACLAHLRTARETLLRSIRVGPLGG